MVNAESEEIEKEEVLSLFHLTAGLIVIFLTMLPGNTYVLIMTVIVQTAVSLPTLRSHHREVPEGQSGNLGENTAHTKNLSYIHPLPKNI